MPYFAWPLVLAGMSSAGIDLPMMLVLPRRLYLDRLEIFRIGELAVDLHLLNDFAIADGAARDAVDHAGVFGRAVSLIGAEDFGAGLDQCHAAGGASA